MAGSLRDRRRGPLTTTTVVDSLDPFTDVRELQQRLKAAGIPFEQEADASTTGPASFMLTDPDGNPVLVDQHR